MLTSWKENYDQPKEHIKKQRHYFVNKGPSSLSFGFSSSHVWMWELDHKEGWVPKNWCFQNVVLEKTLKSPLDSKEIKRVNPKGSVLNIHWKDWCWSWSFSPLATWCKEQTHWKRPWCWERLRAGGEGVTEDETFGWHHWLKGHESEQAPGDGERQGSLACCSPWCCKESDMTERLNNIQNR